MKIGIIGAGLSGLTAGRILARAGHEVSVFEKSKGYGGRMSTRRSGGNPVRLLDHGAPFIAGSSPEFRSFIQELKNNSIVEAWPADLARYSNGTISKETSDRDTRDWHIAPAGMNSIGKYLGRWMDLYFEEKAGGITHIGGAGAMKKAWMINSSSINVFEADAVIIATPAIQAYGLISTAQDEFEMRKMISVLDEIPYSSCYALMARYGKRDIAEWGAMVCDHPVISWICNEGTKRNSYGESIIVTHTTDHFCKRAIEIKNHEQTLNGILSGLKEILGSWAGNPEWCQTHLWRYHLPVKSLDLPFLESDNEDAPIAVTGDYFQGKSMEAAYLSGLKLAEHWASKFA